MTSKEAFDIIVSYVPTCFKDELETIAKDLEKLELIEKALKNGVYFDDDGIVRKGKVVKLFYDNLSQTLILDIDHWYFIRLDCYKDGWGLTEEEVYADEA